MSPTARMLLQNLLVTAAVAMALPSNAADQSAPPETSYAVVVKKSTAQDAQWQKVVAALQEILPEDAVLLSDPGTSCPYLSAYYQQARPGRQPAAPPELFGKDVLLTFDRMS